MVINSSYSIFPYQPNNPSDEERSMLARYSFIERERPEDYYFVRKLLSPPPNITSIEAPGKFKKHKIGIIGGGLAGLSAAFELRKLGFDITIFDALKDRIGGRVYTYYFDKEKTLYGELGPMRIPVIHETVWHYINLFKLNTRTFIQSNNNGIMYLRDVHSKSDPNQVKINIYPQYNLTREERNMSWRKLITYAYDSSFSSVDPMNRTEILQVKDKYNPFTLYWDSISIRQMLKKIKLSKDAINLLSYISPIAGNFFYNSYIDYIEEDYPADMAYLYEIIGGTVKLPLAFYNSFFDENTLNAYPNIRKSDLGTINWKGGKFVTGIYKNNGNITLSYIDEHLSEQQYQEFEYVICTIPFSTLRNLEIKPLFSPEKMQAIKEVTYVNAQKSLVLFKNRFWETGNVDERIIGGPSYTDLPISTIWYPSDHSQYLQKDNLLNNNFTKHPGVLLIYNFNLDGTRLGSLSDNIRFENIKRQIEKVHSLKKGSLDDIALDLKTVNWNSEEWFMGAFCYLTPEQKRLFSYSMSTPEYDNRVFFAGEHISAVHRWMQGALQSGMEAANNLAQACKMNIT